ncbi:MAG: creatininase family protein [Ignavibacteriaceae bacterium]|jgi:creatinine amidohydrolase
MRSYILAESHWGEIKNQKIDLAVLPWAATEAHNYHLPYCTDIIESELIAAEAARIAWKNGAKIIVMPVIPFGVNSGQYDITLDININPGTQSLILNDIVEVLNRQGIYKLLIVNGHGGNNFKQMLRELGLKFPKMFLASCDWYKVVNKSDYFENEGDHADEMETSLMLYLSPNLVLPLEEAGDGNAKKIKIEGINEGWAWTERKWSLVTKDTGVGNPKKASKEKGEKYFKAVSEKLARLYVDIAAADPGKLYE